MKIHFLGTNGWFDSDTGNTICTLIDTDDCYIILDAGFGLSKADKYIKEDKPVYMFISHYHLDHVCGLHVLDKFNFKQGLTIFGSEANKHVNILRSHPFSASMAELSYKVKIIDLQEGEYNKPFKFSCKKLQHVDVDFGYRFYLEDKIITYCTDTAVCENDFLLAQNSDILIHECAFLPGETSSWGHTAPEQAAALAKKAQTKKLVLTHFSGSNYLNLKTRSKIERFAKKIFPNTVAAKDGMTISV